MDGTVHDGGHKHLDPLTDGGGLAIR